MLVPTATRVAGAHLPRNTAGDGGEIHNRGAVTLNGSSSSTTVILATGDGMRAAGAIERYLVRVAERAEAAAARG